MARQWAINELANRWTDWVGRVGERRLCLPEGYGGALIVAFCGVVEDDIQDDLDAPLVALLHHGFELCHNCRAAAALLGSLAVPCHGRKEPYCGIAPVVETILVGPRDQLQHRQTAPQSISMPGMNLIVSLSIVFALAT